MTKMVWKQTGTLIFDQTNKLMVCELSTPQSKFVEHTPVGLTDREGWDQAMEHGRLITALPDLLEACLAAHEFLPFVVCDTRDQWNERATIMGKLAEALAKALPDQKGESDAVDSSP